MATIITRVSKKQTGDGATGVGHTGWGAPVSTVAVIFCIFCFLGWLYIVLEPVKITADLRGLLEFSIEWHARPAWGPAVESSHSTHGAQKHYMEERRKWMRYNMSHKYLLYWLSKLSSGCSDNTPDRNNLRGERFGLTVSGRRVSAPWTGMKCVWWTGVQGSWKRPWWRENWWSFYRDRIEKWRSALECQQPRRTSICARLLEVASRLRQALKM